MMIDPTAVTEEVIDLNDDLSIHYTTFRDGYVFTRPAGSWRTWRQHPFSPPTGNVNLLQNHLDGVEFGCCEHVSVVLSGSATYELTTPYGTANYLWSRGAHNVANGFGYLPLERFTRTFRNGFSMCCVIQPIRGLGEAPVYSFEVVAGNVIAPRDAYAAHICGGPAVRSTVFGLSAGDVLEAGPDGLSILIYRSVS